MSSFEPKVILCLVPSDQFFHYFLGGKWNLATYPRLMSNSLYNPRLALNLSSFYLESARVTDVNHIPVEV